MLFILTGCISTGLQNCKVSTFPPEVVLKESRKIGCLNWTVAEIIQEEDTDNLEHLKFFCPDSGIAQIDSIMIIDSLPGYKDKVVLLHLEYKRIGKARIIVMGKDVGYTCRPQYVVTDSMLNLTKEEQICFDTADTNEP